MESVVEELDGQQEQTVESISNQIEMLGEQVGVNGVERYDTRDGKMIEVDITGDETNVQYLVGENGDIEGIGNYRDGEQLDMDLHGDMVEYIIGETVAEAGEYTDQEIEADYEMGSDLQKELMKN